MTLKLFQFVLNVSCYGDDANSHHLKDYTTCYIAIWVHSITIICIEECSVDEQITLIN